MRKNLNIKSFNCDLLRFFRLWLEFLKPFHKMTNKEMEVVSYLLLRRHKLYTKIQDDKMVNEVLINREARSEIKSRMGYSTNQVMSNMLGDLKRKGIIENDGGINRGLIPSYEHGSGNFRLILNFTVKDAPGQ